MTSQVYQRNLVLLFSTAVFLLLCYLQHEIWGLKVHVLVISAIFHCVYGYINILQGKMSFKVTKKMVKLRRGHNLTIRNQTFMNTKLRTALWDDTLHCLPRGLFTAKHSGLAGMVGITIPWLTLQLHLCSRQGIVCVLLTP